MTTKRERDAAESHRAATPDAGAYIGHEPEMAAETIPGGVDDTDERVAAGDTRSTGAGALDERQQGRDDEWPHGHRQGPDASDDDVRRAGDTA